MATYNSLLIDAGGGIIDRKYQADRRPGATLIIGLGGTGADAVIRLKKEVYRRLKPDDVNAAIPNYSDIKYLIIDSGDGWVGRSRGKISDIDRETEFLNIGSIDEVFQKDGGTVDPKELREKYFWLDYNHVSIDDTMQVYPACTRQIGRFLLVNQAEQVHAKMKSTILSALAGSNGKLTIHICTGISGGTGGGIFLDVCYLVRQILKEIGKTETSVCGYFFLPDVSLSVPQISTDPLISGYVKVNGYAALQELDYCMNFSRNKDSFKMNYGFKQIDDRQKPVDLCYLVSATDEQGKMVSDGYNYAMSVVTDYIISFMIKEYRPEDPSDGLGLLFGIPGGFKGGIKDSIHLNHGANVEYNILGASVAEMPRSEIAAYLGFRLFERYAGRLDRIPTETERDEFLQATQLNYEDIWKALSKGCPQQISFPDYLDARLFKERGNSQFVSFADEYLFRNMDELEMNSRILMTAMKAYTIPNGNTSLIGRAYKGLCEKFVMNPEYGPFYAQRMLYGTQNLNLIHAVDGFIAQNQNNLEAELRYAQIRADEYNDAMARMQTSNFLNERGKLADYLYALNNLYVHHYKVKLLQTMNTVLQEYKQQLVQLNNHFFRILTIVLDTLQKTFQENGWVVTQGAMSDHSCNWKILSVPDIRESLDAEVQKLDFQQTFHNLMGTLVNSYTKWLNEDESEITKLITDFILDTFQDTAKKTTTDYLKEKFQADSMPLLAQRIEEEIIRNKLAADSVPLFWRNSLYLNEVGMSSTLTVPYSSAEIKAAAHDYADKRSEVDVQEAYMMDRISMTRVCCGLPMYAYQGILELQESYEKDTTPGRHLYEGREMNWNEWLPSPVPASFKAGTPIARIEKKNNALTAEFERAEEAGVVVKDTGNNWNIMVTDASNAEAFLTTATEAEGGYEINGKIDFYKLNALIARLEAELKKQIESAKPVRIECLKAHSGSERQVMLDFYLMSPVLNRTLHDELEKREAITRKIAELRTLYRQAPYAAR